MARILIPFGDFGNRGGMAVIMGLARCLKRYMPDAEIVVFSPEATRYRELSKFDIQVVPIPWAWVRNERGLLPMIRYAVFFALDCLSCFALRIGGKFSRHIRSPYDEYDVVIHYSADWPNEADWGVRRTILALFMLFAIRTICNRPIATLPATMGPYRSRLTRGMAKFVLDGVHILAAREETSYDYVCSLNLTKPQVVLAPDMGFLLDPAPQDRVREILQLEGINKNDKPFVGLTPNRHAAETLRRGKSISQPRYVELLAQVVDYVVEKLDATVCLIPHVYDYNDREICEQVSERVKHKLAVSFLHQEYLADELKGVIGTCDMFIGSWMHSTIASTSMGVPTLAIAFSDKFYRLIGGMMGQGEYVVDMRYQEPAEILAEIKAKLDALWANREKVEEELKEKTRLIQEQAWLYGELIRKLVQDQ